MVKVARRKGGRRGWKGGTTQAHKGHGMDFCLWESGVLSGMIGGWGGVGMNRNIFTFCVWKDIDSYGRGGFQ